MKSSKSNAAPRRVISTVGLDQRLEAKDLVRRHERRLRESLRSYVEYGDRTNGLTYREGRTMVRVDGGDVLVPVDGYDGSRGWGDTKFDELPNGETWVIASSASIAGPDIEARMRQSEFVAERRRLFDEFVNVLGERLELLPNSIAASLQASEPPSLRALGVVPWLETPGDYIRMLMAREYQTLRCEFAVDWQKHVASLADVVDRKVEALNDLVRELENPLGCEWSRPRTLTDWATVFNCTPKTISRWIRNGRLRAMCINRQTWQIHRSQLPPGTPD